VELTTAESTYTAALGFDWLYDVLTPEERTTVRKAIVKNGLTAGVEHYDKHLRWYARRNNWNQVCNAGLAGSADKYEVRRARLYCDYYSLKLNDVVLSCQF
jgi:hypothetical protein